MALTTTQIRDVICPEFTADTRWTSALEIAAGQLHAANCGSRHQMMACYLAAHILKVAPTTDSDDDAGASGPITSKSAGDLSVSYGSVSTSSTSVGDASLMTTAYGREFLRLRGGVAARSPRVVDAGV